MAPLTWSLLTCLLLSYQVTVLSQRHSGSVGIQCCPLILQKQFPEEHYHRLQSYRQLPSVGQCKEYLEFNMTNGFTFCVKSRMAQKLKEVVDSRQGAAEARVRHGIPVPVSPSRLPTSPEGQKVITDSRTSPGPQERDHGIGPSTSSSPQLAATTPHRKEDTPTTSPSAKSLPWPKEEDRGSGPSTLSPPQLVATGPHAEEGTGLSTQRSPQWSVTGPHGEKGTGPSTQRSPQWTVTGPHEEEGTGPSTQPSPQWSVTGPHGEEGTPTSSPLSTTLPGLQEGRGETSHQPTLQTSSRDQISTHETALTETGSVSLTPRDTTTSTPTNPLDGHEAGEDRTSGHSTSHGATRRGGGPRAKEEDGFGMSPNPGSSHKHRGEPGKAIGDRSRLYGLLVLLAGLILIVMFVHIQRTNREATQVAPVKLIRYSKILGSSNEMV